MRYAHITPVALLDEILTPEDTFHLMVSSVAAESPEYVKYYLRRKALGDWVTMDSPVFELRGEVDWETHLQQVVDFNPSEAVLPDDMDSPYRTYHMASAFAGKLHLNGYRGNLMAVPHGNTLERYLSSASDLACIGGVTTLGIQEEVEEMFGVSRQWLSTELSGMFGVGMSLHYLGFTEHLRELLDSPKVRSADSGKIVTWGLRGLTATPTAVRNQSLPEYPGRTALGGRTEYFQYNGAGKAFIELTRANIAAWRDETTLQRMALREEQ